MVSYFYLPQPNFSRQHADHNLVALRDEQQLQSVNADDYLCLFSSYSNTILNTGTNKCMRMISSTSIVVVFIALNHGKIRGFCALRTIRRF